MINLIYTVLPTITLIVGFYIGFSTRNKSFRNLYGKH